MKPAFLEPPAFPQAILAVALLLLAAVPASAGGGEESSAACQWVDDYFISGLSGSVHAVLEFDDGSGNALYAGGAFRSADDQITRHIARWDGNSWENVGEGFDNDVYALAVYDSGNGPRLIAAGSFFRSGGPITPRIAEWNGTSWSALGGGIAGAQVNDLTVWNDNGDLKLVAGGFFAEAGGVPALRIAQWDGTAWSALGSGMNNWVEALTVFDDGNGEDLIAGGDFTTAGGNSTPYLARWDGATWSTVGNGLSSNIIFDVETFDDGEGNVELVVAGVLTSAGGSPASYLARFDGATWSTFPSEPDPLPNQPASSRVYALRVIDDGNGPDLFVGGDFQSIGGLAAPGVARWDGTSWSAPGFGIGHRPTSFATFDDGDGNAVISAGIGAAFDTPRPIQELEDGVWVALADADGGLGLTDIAYAQTVFTDPTGSRLVMAGQFSRAGGAPAARIAAWDGDAWSSFNTGLDTIRARTVAVYDAGDGAGPNLYATTSSGLKRWDGEAWTVLSDGGPVGGTLYSLAVWDDGSGPVLVVGGSFDFLGNQVSRGIAQWDGASWAPLGGAGPNSVLGVPYALEVFNDGNGDRLIVAGDISRVKSLEVGNIAQWDGTSWAPLGSGTDDDIRALTVFDDGTPRLLVGGEFSTAGGGAVPFLAAWDGAAWSDPGADLDQPVWALTSFDRGDGPIAVAGGDFLWSGSKRVHRLVQTRDGLTWSDLNGGVDGRVETLGFFDDGTGANLFVGGDIRQAGETVSAHVAEYDCPLPRLDIADGVPALGSTARLPMAYVSDDAELFGVDFSLDLDETCLDFDTTDGDMDGVPDAVLWNGPPGYDLTVTFDPMDADAELAFQIADPTRTLPLDDGTLLFLELDVVCSPPPGGTREATVGIASDPEVSFIDNNGDVVFGIGSGGSAELAVGLRADCDGSGILDAGDLAAVESEIFDGDGTFWGNVAGGSFAGDPAGCDANGDTAIDAGDLSCLHQLISSGICVEGPAPLGDGLTLELGPGELAVNGGLATAILTVHTPTYEINSLTLSLNLENGFAFDPTDGDGNGLPDSVRLFQGAVPGLELRGSWDAGDTDGMLDLVLTRFAGTPGPSLPDPVMVEIDVTPANSQNGWILQPWRFAGEAPPSMGAVDGTSPMPEAEVIMEGFFEDGFESGNTGDWGTEVP